MVLLYIPHMHASLEDKELHGAAIYREYNYTHTTANDATIISSNYTARQINHLKMRFAQ